MIGSKKNTIQKLVLEHEISHMCEQIYVTWHNKQQLRAAKEPKIVTYTSNMVESRIFAHKCESISLRLNQGFCCPMKVPNKVEVVGAWPKRMQ